MMKARPSPRPRQLFAPPENSLCLCGSGARFRVCCKPRLPAEGQAWLIAAEAKRWLEVVRCLRADVTQYSIWHLSHTAPAVRAKPMLRFGYLMNIDIEALAEHAEKLMWAYMKKGWSIRIPEMLDRLRTNIDDERWRQKIAYLRAIAALWIGDRQQAREEIEGLQPITPDATDVDLLQLHVDLYNKTMGLTERLAYFERISILSKRRSDRLQYGGARAFEILLIEDEAGARTAFDDVIALGREMEAERPLSLSAEIWFCRVLEGRAVLGDAPKLFAEIDQRLTRLVDGDHLTAEGKADVWRNLADVRRYAGKFAPALEAYRRSMALKRAPELRTFEAECELRLGNPDEAFRLIRSVAVNELDQAERADHAFTFFYIALARGDRRSLEDARDLLKQAVTPHPYFQHRRLQHIVTVGEALEALETKQELPSLGPILKTLKKVSRYAQLQPNWAGIGIDGNAIIDDLVKRAEDQQRKQAQEIPSYPRVDGPGPKKAQRKSESS